MPWRFLLLLLLILLNACGGGGTSALPAAGEAPFAPTPVVGFTLLAEYPHDSSAFTQGLITDNTSVLESTGGYGASVLRRWNLQTGAVAQQVSLDPDHFGEGIARHGEQIYQLTWKAQVLYVWNADDLSAVGRLGYQGEGWGLTSDGSELIRSDGSDRLHFHRPADFQETRSILVKDGTQPVTLLNELEFIRGEIWANVWHSQRIARIDPTNGQVRSWVDLNGLASAEVRGTSAENVLNGIAYDPSTDRLLVTGKRWTRVFEISVNPQ